MTFEAEETILLACRYYGDEKQYDSVLPLPRRLTVVIDNHVGYAELTFTPDEPEDLDEIAKRIDELQCFYMVATNDPYAWHNSPIVNLGYHMIQMAIANGEGKIKDGKLVYYTEAAGGLDIRFNVPLKGIAQMKEKPEYLLEYKGEPNTYQIIDIEFGANMIEDIVVRHYKWFYRERQGAFIHYITNLQSIMNGHTLVAFDNKIATIDAGIALYKKSLK